MKYKVLLSLLLCFAMLASVLSLITVSAEESEPYKTEYVKVNSIDEIVPGARYIIVGTYTDDEGNVTYHAMGKENRPYDGFRYSYAQDQNGAHNFDISEDKSKITVYSYPSYDPILRVRITPRDDEGRFYLQVDGEGYLCGYSKRSSDGANGHDLHSCLPISTSTIGETWWYMRVPTEGDYAGDWQIVNRSRLGDYSGYYYDVIRMGRPYPNIAGQFRAEPVFREDVGSLDEDEYIKYTKDADTNILIYREICTHRSDEVTHKAAVNATCGQPGIMEYWYCAGCRQYFSNEDMTDNTTPGDFVIAPPLHSYNQSGVCTKCGDVKNSLTFIEYDESSYGSDMDGEIFIFVGFKGDKAYVMGNKTNTDGSREAVEVSVKPNGAITTNSETAEFFNFDFNPPTAGVTFSPDNGYMSMVDGKIIVYDKSLATDEGIPEPIKFTSEGYQYSLGYFYHWSSDYYIVFDPDSLTFKVSDTPSDSIVQYKQVCSHENMYHTPGDEPTCTEQGATEYWYCDDCYCYFMNGDFESPVEIYDQSELNMPATGHKFGPDGICENCSMLRNVYSPITSLDQFDQLSGDAYFIIVFKDGDKTYAARIPDLIYPCDEDLNGNGTPDILEADANFNDFPDIIEEYIDTNWDGCDENEDGVITAEEYKNAVGDYDGDEDIDFYDLVLFFEYNIHWDIHMLYEEEAYATPNFTQVTIAPDGTITIVDEGALEFQMIEGGVWGSQPNEDWMLEEYGIKDTDRLRAAWIPNYWIANGGMLGYYDEGHLMIQERTYGDFEYPGIIDNKNWKISFNPDGTALLISTWADFDDTAALQLIKYTDADGNERMTMIGCYGSQWEYSDIISRATVMLPAYIYACEPVYATPPHTCDFGDWTDNGDGTHIRICTDATCGKSETETHDWDNGSVTTKPTCTDDGVKTYICTTCTATKTEAIPELGHSFSSWADAGETHSHSCNNDGCNATESDPHDWSDWTSDGEAGHIKSCSICSAERTEEHDYDEGVITTPPTEDSEGVKTYTCQVCMHEKTESIDKLEHVHNFGDWIYDDGNTHSKSCACGETQTEDHHFGDGEVIQGPTHTAVGQIKYTCSDCFYEKYVDIPSISDHEWSDWVALNDGSHRRECICGESETESHSFDDGEITKEPTEEEEGILTYTCENCGHEKTESIDKVIHIHNWSDWKENGNGGHSRYCNCGESETDEHDFDSGAVVKESSHLEEGLKVYTCSVCDATREEAIEKTPDHSFVNGKCECGESDPNYVPPHEHVFVDSKCECGEEDPNYVPPHEHDWSDWKENGNGGHSRYCNCGESETDEHDFDSGAVVKESSHLEEGLKVYTCSVCDATREEAIEKTPDHSFGEWICNATVVGKHYRECACGERENSDCSWDNGKVSAEPTYEAEGERTYTCTECGGTKTESISKLITNVENIEAGITLDVIENSNVYIPAGTVIDVVEKPAEEIPDEVLGEIAVTADGAAKPLGMYDLSLLLDGAKIQPNGTVEITLPAPDLAAEYDRIIVVYIAPDGGYEECKTTVNEDGTITFETDHFSQYAVIGITESDVLYTGVVIGIVAGALVLLGGGGFAIFWFVIMKKSTADLLALIKSNTKTVHRDSVSKKEAPAEENIEKSSEGTNVE